MKTIVPVKKHTVPEFMLLSIVTVLLTALYTPAVAAGPATVRYATGDSILVQKKTISKKFAIKLYPNASHEVLFFSASGEEGRVYQLFLFDLEGKLVKQVNIRNKQTTVLNSIDKGDYLFEVFSEDERIENGQVIIR